MVAVLHAPNDLFQRQQARVDVPPLLARRLARVAIVLSALRPSEVDEAELAQQPLPLGS